MPKRKSLLRGHQSEVAAVFHRLNDPVLFGGSHKHRFEQTTRRFELEEKWRQARPSVICLSQEKPRKGKRASVVSVNRDPRSIFDRLCDTSTYHGTHKYRFDKEGKGRGLLGRDSVMKGKGTFQLGFVEGSVADLSQIMRTNLRESSKMTEQDDLKRTQKLNKSPDRHRPHNEYHSMNANNNVEEKVSVFDRLCDPKSFHGTHKHRFDGSGRGLGKIGRTMPDTKIRDLSQIMRPNLI